MKTNKYPAVSIVIPTLNSERTLKLCLESINKQHYSGDLEIVMADGGSTDKTLFIAKKYNTKIFQNVLKTGEAGKAVGLKHSTGEIIGFVDSDNVLPDKNWLQEIILPFIEDDEIIASEPVRFVYRKTDHWLTRYFALLGMGDPLNLFIGWYDKYSYVSNMWTGIKIKTKDNGKYFSFYLGKDIPTIGANGFFMRKTELSKYPLKDYLFDIDVLKLLAKKKRIKIAKVKIGIVHLFSGDIKTFIRKQKRRIMDYLFYKKQSLRESNDNNIMTYIGILKFITSTILILPLFYQTLRGYLRKKDNAWLFHPLACWITLFAYASTILSLPFINEIYNRDGWKQ